MTDRQVRVLLTGGIGSGKSMVGELLRARGAFVIDADRVGHGVLEPGGEAFETVAAEWPEVVTEGRIDRGKLADIVFRERAALAKLEGMTHPAIRRRIRELVDASDARLVVVEVPHLDDFLGPGWLRVVVDAPVDVRLARMQSRGTGDVMRRLEMQPSPAEWRDFADEVIDNSGGPDRLIRRVDDLLAKLEARFSRMPPSSPTDAADA